jgi:enoyl-CoA hydratase/carnithine racemase
MQAVKEQVATDWTGELETSVQTAGRLVKEPARRPDFREGVAAYAEKRAPKFAPLPPSR